MPDGESVRFLMIPVFLRGSTNPPPENWFTKVETWNKHVREEGVVITVPDRSATGADLPGSADRRRLRNAAGRGAGQARSIRPRLAGSESGQSGPLPSRQIFERSQGNVQQRAASVLHDRSVLLARSLNIKLDNDCFQKPRQQQESCLTQNTDQLVLDDGHSQSMVAALTSGSGPDLVGQLSTTRLAGGGSLQPVRRCGRGSGENDGKLPYSGVPLHSGTGAASRR